MKTALISGVSGQDGAYLAKLLLEKGYRVCGTSRDARMSTFHNLERLGIRDKVQLESVALNDFRSVIQVLLRSNRTRSIIWPDNPLSRFRLNNPSKPRRAFMWRP